jgi:V-type H+-transporting ATPase subunit a
MKAPATINEYYMAKEGLHGIMQVADYKMFDSIEKEVQEYDEFLVSQTKSLREIHNDYHQLREYRHAIKSAGVLLAKLPGNWSKMAERSNDAGMDAFSGRDGENNKEDAKKNDSNQTYELSHVRLGHIIGSLNAKDSLIFRRLIFRSTRGNALMQLEPMNLVSVKEKEIPKTSFVITFQEGAAIREKLERISKAFGARLYELPTENVNYLLKDIDEKIRDTKRLLKGSNKELKSYLVKINDLESRRKLGGNSPFYGISTLPMYRMVIQIEEEIYRNMNCLKSVDNGNIKYGFVWSKIKAHDIMKELENKDHNLPELQFQDVTSHEFETPTFIKTNEFTEQFQVIVDTYGIPNYKEVNPTVFTIISFPFLFGVMFGDIGHGSLLLIVASLITIFGEGNAALKPVYGSRYLLLMMGFFSLFCGIMYNDFMSIPLDIAGTCYSDSADGTVLVKPD